MITGNPITHLEENVQGLCAHKGFSEKQRDRSASTTKLFQKKMSIIFNHYGEYFFLFWEDV